MRYTERTSTYIGTQICRHHRQRHAVRQRYRYKTIIYTITHTDQCKNYFRKLGKILLTSDGLLLVVVYYHYYC